MSATVFPTRPVADHPHNHRPRYRTPVAALLAYACLTPALHGCHSGNPDFDEQLDTGWATFIITQPTRTAGAGEGHDLPTSSGSEGNFDKTSTLGNDEASMSVDANGAEGVGDDGASAGENGESGASAGDDAGDTVGDSAATGDETASTSGADAGSSGGDEVDTTSEVSGDSSSSGGDESSSSDTMADQTTGSSESSSESTEDVGASSAQGDDGGDAEGSDTGQEACQWVVRRLLTVNGLRSGVELNNVPVLIRLNYSRIDYNLTHTGGIDLRFFDESADELYDYEIDRWSFEGTSYIWVRFPTLRASQRVWMYYGWRAGPGVTLPTGERVDDTWADSYLGVWHLDEDLTDSSGAGQHARGAFVEPDPGKIGTSQVLSQISNLQLGLPELEDFSLSVWLRMGDSPDTASLLGKALAPTILVRGPDTGSRSGRLAVEDGDDAFHTGRSLDDDGWTHVVVSRDGTNMSFYLDGRDAGTTTFDGGFTPGTVGNLGLFDGGFAGEIDELRIRDVPQSSEWVEAQFLSMTDELLHYGGNEAVVDSCPTVMASTRAPKK